MKAQNAAMQRQNVAKISRDFAMASEKMTMSEDMMNDALADAVSSFLSPRVILPLCHIGA